MSDHNKNEGDLHDGLDSLSLNWLGRLWRKVKPSEKKERSPNLKEDLESKTTRPNVSIETICDQVYQGIKKNGTDTFETYVKDNSPDEQQTETVAAYSARRIATELIENVMNYDIRDQEIVLASSDKAYMRRRWSMGGTADQEKRLNEGKTLIEALSMLLDYTKVGRAELNKAASLYLKFLIEDVDEKINESEDNNTEFRYPESYVNDAGWWKRKIKDAESFSQEMEHLGAETDANIVSYLQRTKTRVDKIIEKQTPKVPRILEKNISDIERFLENDRGLAEIWIRSCEALCDNYGVPLPSQVEEYKRRL